MRAYDPIVRLLRTAVRRGAITDWRLELHARRTSHLAATVLGRHVTGGEIFTARASLEYGGRGTTVTLVSRHGQWRELRRLIEEGIDARQEWSLAASQAAMTSPSRAGPRAYDRARTPTWSDLSRLWGDQLTDWLSMQAISGLEVEIERARWQVRCHSQRLRAGRYDRVALTPRTPHLDREEIVGTWLVRPEGGPELAEIRAQVRRLVRLGASDGRLPCSEGDVILAPHATARIVAELEPPELKPQQQDGIDAPRSPLPVLYVPAGQLSREQVGPSWLELERVDSLRRSARGSTFELTGPARLRTVRRTLNEVAAVQVRLPAGAVAARLASSSTRGRRVTGFRVDGRDVVAPCLHVGPLRWRQRAEWTR